MNELRRAAEGHVGIISNDAAFGLVCITCGKILGDFPNLDGVIPRTVFSLNDHAVFFDPPHDVVVVNVADKTCLPYPQIPEDIILH